MKTAPVFLLALLLTQCATAQFWLVYDKVGYVNVRHASDTKSRIVDTLNNGHIVYFLDGKPAGDWTKIEYTRRDKSGSGYIYHHRLKSIADYDSIPLLDHNEHTATCARDSVKVVVTQQKFDRGRYRFTYNHVDQHEKNIADRQIIKINGKQYWGTDGDLPKREYKSIVIFVGNRKIVLPHSAIDNLFEPTIWYTEVHYDRINDVFYIRSQNSDGAGAYDVVWRIVKGVYTDRDIEYGF